MKLRRCPKDYVSGLLCLFAPGLGLAEADGPDFWREVGVATDAVLNIRAEATPGSAQIGEIPPGASCIRSLGCRGGLTLAQFMELSEAEQAVAHNNNPRWCQVDYISQRGWVAGHYLTEDDCQRQPGSTKDQK